MRSVLDYFSEATGVDVKYSSSENYEQQIVIDTQAGSPPNIAILPQPGLIAGPRLQGPPDAARRRHRRTGVKDNYGAGQSWVDLGTYKDKDGKPTLLRLPLQGRPEVAGLVLAGQLRGSRLRSPQDLGRPEALTDKIVADGGTPWCIGLGSGGATGWPATDWVEDIMLRTQPPEIYDKWVKNEIPFNDPAVVAAHRRSSAGIAKNDKICRRRRGGGRRDRLPRQPEGPLLGAAEVLHAPPGLVHPVLLPGRHRSSATMPTSSTSRPTPPSRSRQAGARRRHAGRRSPRTRQAARAFIDFLKMPLAHEIWMAQSRLPDAAQDGQHGRLRQRRAEEAGRDPAQRHDLPLRRLGPDARQDRRRRLLDRHGRLRRRQVRPQDVAADIQTSWDAIK